MNAVPAVVKRAELGQLGDMLAGQSGESIGIYRLTGTLAASGLLFKHYKETAAHDGRSAALEQLVAFGRSTGAAGRSERETLLAATSWPTASVTDERGTLIGCLIPEAPGKFRADGKLREIDTLAQSGERLAAQGLSVSPEQRLAVCRQIADVAAALELRRLVYSDWNYANALWCAGDSSVFIIDIDGCRAEKMPNICQSGWEDPLTDPSAPADKYTDRFRVALLTARCLTGERAKVSVLHALADASNRAVPGRETLLDMLWAADRTKRPSAAALRAALDSVEVRFGVTRRPLPAAPAGAERPRRTPPKVNRTSKLIVTGSQPVIPADPQAPPPPVWLGLSRAALAILWVVAILVAILIGTLIALH